MAGRRDPSLQRYLLDGERVVVSVRQHWGKLSGPLALALAGLLFVLWVDAHTRVSTGAVTRLLWMLWLGLLLWTIYQVLSWRHDRFVATDKRLLLSYGLLTQRVAMMPLMKVTDMSYQRSVPGRVFGYGQFILESAGQDQAIRQIDWVPRPDHTYRVICAEIFGVDDHDRVLVERGSEDDGRADNRDDNHPRPGPVVNPLGQTAGEDPASPIQQSWTYSQAIPLHQRPEPPVPSGEVIYNSDQARLRRRMADTGPIPPVPPQQADD